MSTIFLNIRGLKLGYLAKRWVLDKNLVALPNLTISSIAADFSYRIGGSVRAS